MADHRSKMTLMNWLALVGTVGCIVLLVVCAYLFGLSRASDPAAASAPIASSSGAVPVSPTAGPGAVPQVDVDTDVAPAPGMIPRFAPPDGPDPDDPMYGVDVAALATELRTHAVDTPPEMLPLLLAMTNRHIARGEADLKAWDEEMTDDVRELYPDLRRGLVIDVTRCWAEYVERVEARNAGKVAPPDSDDHGVTVDKRAPQPQLSQPPIVTPTS